MLKAYQDLADQIVTASDHSTVTGADLLGDPDFGADYLETLNRALAADESGHGLVDYVKKFGAFVKRNLATGGALYALWYAGVRYMRNDIVKKFRAGLHSSYPTALRHAVRIADALDATDVANETRRKLAGTVKDIRRSAQNAGSDLTIKAVVALIGITALVGTAIALNESDHKDAEEKKQLAKKKAEVKELHGSLVALKSEINRK